MDDSVILNGRGLPPDGLDSDTEPHSYGTPSRRLHSGDRGGHPAYRTAGGGYSGNDSRSMVEDMAGGGHHVGAGGDDGLQQLAGEERQRQQKPSLQQMAHQERQQRQQPPSLQQLAHQERQQRLQPQTTLQEMAHQQLLEQQMRRQSGLAAYDAGYKLGLSGWRRRCLYVLLLFLTATVTLNLALTLFFMRVLDFSSTGLGALQIVKGGLVATGPVHVMDSLVATHVTSRPHVPLTVLASHNISVAALNSQGDVTSSLVLGANSLSCATGRLSVKDAQGRLLFSASREEVVVGARRLVVAGEGGAAFSGSIQTGHVSAPVGKSLLLESTTRNLEVSAPQGVTVESRAGSITAHCLGDLTLQSTGGTIKLATSRLVVRGLPTSTVQSSNPATVGPDVYQVCVCSGGRIFLAAPGGVCAADHNFCK